MCQVNLNDREPRQGAVKIFLISILACLLAGVADNQNGLSHGTAICILRTENQIVVAADSREVNERNEPQKPVNKIIDLGGMFEGRANRLAATTRTGPARREPISHAAELASLACDFPIQP